MSKISLFAMILLASTALCAMAGDSADADSGLAPPVANLKDHGLKIVKRVDAPGKMIGYVAKAGQQRLTLYVTPDRQHVVIGTLLDAGGNNLSQQSLDSVFGAADTKKQWQQLADSHWIADGPDDASRIVYEFTDPNCPYCQLFYQKARPWVKAGKVQIRHILVAVLKPSSRSKSAAILGADDPGKALARNENNFKSGGIDPVDTVSAAIGKKIATNTELMSQLRVRGTPGIVYRDDDGMIQKIAGLPSDKRLEAILGSR